MPPRLLLVDDEPPILASLRRLLAFEDYEVVVEADAGRALRLLAAEPVAVVLSDQHMPGMQGVEFLRRAREVSPDTSRILFSGHIDVDLLRTAVNGGEVYRFVTKPWDDDEVLAALRQGVERWHLLQANRRLTSETERANDELKRLNAQLAKMVARRTVEIELRHHALTLSQRVIDRLPVGVMGVDPELTVVLVNRLAQRLFPGAIPGEGLALAVGEELAAWAGAQVPRRGDGLDGETAEAASHFTGHNRAVASALGPVRLEVHRLPEGEHHRGLVIAAVPLGFDPDQGWLE